MDTLDSKQAHQIWLQAQEMVKDRVIAPTLYRALELGVGVALDGDHYVLGFSNADTPMASHLRSGQYHAIIEQCLSQLLKKKIHLLIIEGTNLKDYETYKSNKAAREATQTVISEKKAEERAIIQAWDEVGEKITRAYAKLQMRQLPQARAFFMKQAFTAINEAVISMGYTPQSPEIQHRAVARVFEKFATTVDIPSTLLAYEFFRLREEGKLK